MLFYASNCCGNFKMQQYVIQKQAQRDEDTCPRSHSCDPKPGVLILSSALLIIPSASLASRSQWP